MRIDELFNKWIQEEKGDEEAQRAHREKKCSAKKKATHDGDATTHFRERSGREKVNLRASCPSFQGRFLCKYLIYKLVQ